MVCCGKCVYRNATSELSFKCNATHQGYRCSIQNRKLVNILNTGIFSQLNLYQPKYLCDELMTAELTATQLIDTSVNELQSMKPQI